jgi:hypothetical protein
MVQAALFSKTQLSRAASIAISWLGRFAVKLESRTSKCLSRTSDVGGAQAARSGERAMADEDDRRRLILPAPDEALQTEYLPEGWYNDGAFG